MIIVCTVVSVMLNAETRVLALSGSLREDSVNKKLLLEAAEMARKSGASVTVIDLNDYPLPFFDGDLEAKEGMPERANKLYEQLVQSQVVLIASPEYNASVTGVLKNALDWVSRPQGQRSSEAFKGKKFILLSASPGRTGGARGLVHLRAIIEDLGGTVIPEQISLPDAMNAFDAQGHLKNHKIKAELEQLVQKTVVLELRN